MVYILLANGFEEIEALVPLDMMRRAKIPVKTVGIGAKLIQGTHQITITADILDSEIPKDNLQMLVLPGGMPGTTNLEKSTVVQSLIQHCTVHSIPIAAICAAPMILGHLGLLGGKRAVCSPGFIDELKGAKVTHNQVEVDGNFITAIGAGASIEFAAQIINRLNSKEIANEVLEGMKCKIRI